MDSNQSMTSLIKNISGLYGQSVKPKTSITSISGIYLASITFIVIVENILTLNVVYRKKRMRPPDILLGCLATTDLLTALFVFPLLITHSIASKWPGGLAMCYINTFASVACLKFSMLLASWIAVDRFLAIAKPFLYRSKVNMKKIILIVVSTLLYSVVVALMPVAGMAMGNVGTNTTKWSSCVYHFPAIKAKFWSTIYVILNMMDSTFAVLVVLVSNVSVTIYFVKRKRRKRMVAPVTEAPVTDSFDKQDRSEKQTRSDLKYAHLMGIASLYFALSFVPVSVLVFLHHYGWTKMALFTVISIQLHVASVNLLLNPLLYGLIRRHYRGAYWFIVKNPLLLCGQSTEHRFDFDAGKKNSYKRRLKFRHVGLAAVVSARLASFSSSKNRREQGNEERSASRTQFEKPDVREDQTSTARRIVSACSIGSDYDVNRQDSIFSTFLQVPDSSHRRDSGTSYSSNTEMESLPSSPGYQHNAPVAFGSRLSSLTPCSDNGTDQLVFCGPSTYGRPSLASPTSMDFSQRKAFEFSHSKLRLSSFSSSPSDSLDQKDSSSFKKIPHQLPPLLVINSIQSKPEFEVRPRSRSGRLLPLVRTAVELHNDEQKKSSSDCNYFSTVIDTPSDDIFEYVKPAEEVYDIVSSEKKLRKKRRKRRRKKVQEINVSS